MDYTKVPRELIYRERRSLEEFGAYEENNITRPFLDELLKFGSDRYPNIEENALWCMNNAFYICTMILLEKDPRPRIYQYKNIATPENINDRFISDKYWSVVLSMVFLLLERIGGKLTRYQDEARHRLLTLIAKDVNSVCTTMFNSLSKRIKDDTAIPKVIPCSMFAPRIIDKEAVSDALLEKKFNWPKFTNYWEERSLRDIVMTLGNTEEEKNNVINVLLETANGFYYTKGYNPNIEEVKKKLNCIGEEIRSHFNSEIEDEQNDQCTKIGDKSEDGNNFGNTNADNGQQKKIIKDLERQLKESQATIEDLTQPVEELNAEQKVRMAFALQLLKAAGLTDEVLKKHGNKAKAASIMSLLLNIISNNSRGNKAQICQTFISDPRYYPRDDNKDTLKRLNSLCSDLGINVCLSIESQSNK